MLKIVATLLALAFGAFMFWYGEIDDSPGAMLIGSLFALTNIWLLLRKLV